MTEIVTITFPKCGTCVYAQPSASNMHDCHGYPPSVQILGATKDALGRPSLQIEAMVPKVRGDRPACSLYKAKEDFATLGRS